MTLRYPAGLLMLTLAAPACDQPAPPPVAHPPPSLHADDVAVLKGAVDAVRERGHMSRVLVVETTIAACEKAIDVVAPPPGGCLGPDAIDSVAKVLPSQSRVTAMVDFRTRNARRLPIAGDLGPDVTFVSATINDFGSGILTVSAPSYPAPGTALVFVRVNDADAAALRLVRQPDGQWKVEART